MGSWFTCYPGRPDYFTHWGGAFKYAASLLGLPDRRLSRIRGHRRRSFPRWRNPRSALRTERLGLVDQ